jgi:hypothetical protein
MGASYYRYAFSKFGFNPEADGAKAGYKPFMLLVKGDDVLFCVEKCDQALAQMAIKTYFATKNERISYGLGLVVKYCKWGRLDEMDFLSNQFFQRVDGTHRMVRIPARAIQSMPWSTKLLPTSRTWKEDQKQLCYSKGACMLSWAKGLPIFGKLAKRYIELGTFNVLRDKEWLYVDKYRVWEKEHESDGDSFQQWLNMQYGITGLDIQQIEDAIDRMDLTTHMCVAALDKFY